MKPASFLVWPLLTDMPLVSKVQSRGLPECWDWRAMLSWIVVQGCFPSSMKKRCKSLTRRSFQIGHVQLSSDVPLAPLFLLIFFPSSSTFLKGFIYAGSKAKSCETFRKSSPFLSAWPRCEERGGRVDAAMTPSWAVLSPSSSTCLPQIVARFGHHPQGCIIALSSLACHRSFSRSRHPRKLQVCWRLHK